MTDNEAVTGIILAGGMSTRFGSNKALSQFDGERLIYRLCKTISAVTDRITLITNTPEEYAFLKLPSTRDLVPRCGPIGGIYTALKMLDTPLCLCVACDMPFIKADFLKYMIERSPGFDIVVPMNNRREEPLCALYRDSCTDAVEKQIQSGKHKITEFYDKVRVLRLEPENSGFPDPDMFFNINSRIDYKEGIRRLEKERRLSEQ